MGLERVRYHVIIALILVFSLSSFLLFQNFAMLRCLSSGLLRTFQLEREVPPWQLFGNFEGSRPSNHDDEAAHVDDVGAYHPMEWYKWPRSQV